MTIGYPNGSVPYGGDDDLALRVKADLACGGCGGPHRFDTSVPSVLWNQVIRPLGVSEYLCTSCILAHFARAGVSFVAELYGDGFHGLPVSFTINGVEAQAAAKIQDENNALRFKLAHREAQIAALRDVIMEMRERVKWDGPLGEKNEIEDWADRLDALSAHPTTQDQG